MKDGEVSRIYIIKREYQTSMFRFRSHGTIACCSSASLRLMVGLFFFRRLDPVMVRVQGGPRCGTTEQPSSPGRKSVDGTFCQMCAPFCNAGRGDSPSVGHTQIHPFERGGLDAGSFCNPLDGTTLERPFHLSACQ